MPRHRDLITFVGAIALHVGIAYAFLRVPKLEPPRSHVVEFEIKPPPPQPALTPPPPPPKAAEPPPPPPPPVHRQITKRRIVEPPPPQPPPPNAEPPKEPPKDPPKDPPKPIFGVTMDSVTDRGSSFSVPVGNTTMIDPATSAKRAGPVQPLPAAPPPDSRPYKPVSALHLKTMPIIDADECGRGVPYPAAARERGIEGNVVLRVSLDEKGRVHDVKVVTGLGYGLDEAAAHALRTSARCRFTPAIASDGSPAAYVIPAYTFHFELPK